MKEIVRLSFGYCLLGGLFGFSVSAILWFLLGLFFWMPYFDILRQHKVLVDDNGWAMGTVFFPIGVGVVLCVSTLCCLLMLRFKPWGRLTKPTLLIVNMLPGWIFLALHLNSLWRTGLYAWPGAELAFLLVGACWGFILHSHASEKRNVIGKAIV